MLSGVCKRSDSSRLWRRDVRHDHIEACSLRRSGGEERHLALVSEGQDMIRVGTGRLAKILVLGRDKLDTCVVPDDAAPGVL